MNEFDVGSRGPGMSERPRGKRRRAGFPPAVASSFEGLPAASFEALPGAPAAAAASLRA